MENKYNINELLEEKKHLESQIEDKQSFTSRDLTYVEEKTVDRNEPKNNRVNVLKDRFDINKFCSIYNGYVDRLAKVKTAIQKFNADSVAEMLQQRDAVRNKIVFLNGVKDVLPRDSAKSRKVMSQDKDGNPIEILETINEPMFDITTVDEELDKLCAQERKLNTEIQKVNLNAEITL